MIDRLFLNISFLLSVLFLVVLVATVIGADDFTAAADCRAACRCKWIQGKKAGDCSNSKLTAIPRGLSNDLQLLDLQNNNITHLPANVFRLARLDNLHMLILRDSNIQDVHEDAFRGLQILIEIDLTGNRIHTLHPGTFRDFARIREVYLNSNPLQKLENGLFNSLPYLQKVEVGNCQLKHIGDKTFSNVTGLRILKLDGNYLTHIKLSVVEDLDKLSSLELYNNPWRCDCYLRPFVEWTISRKLYAKPTHCVEPNKLNRTYWNEVDLNEFACKPQIVYPSAGTVIDLNSDVTYLRCHVLGDPIPDMNWVYNGRIVTNHSRHSYSQGHHFIVKDDEWVNLTLVNMGPNDAKGDFKCVAQNGAGIEERNVTFGVFKNGSGLIGSGAVSDNWGLLIILLCAVIILLSLLLLFCCCFCRKRTSALDRAKAKKSHNGLSPNGDVHHITADSTEQGKSLLTVVNPLQKPPRRYDQNSPTFNGTTTEMTELNRKVLDENHINDDDSRVGDSIEDMRLSGRRSTTDSKYPPDLLSFPPNLRAAQSSPAGSSGSAVMPGNGNDSRSSHLSPVHSPTYMYGTLPYSRSQSPFSTPIGVPVQQRQGYVTIPRRPRGSWSTATTPTLELGHLKAEPVYDSYGLRTTADGSILSLNKIDHQKRQLPPTPNSRHSFTLPHKMHTLPHNYRTAMSPTGEPPGGVIRPLPVMKSPGDRYMSLPRGDLGQQRDEYSEDRFRRPTSPNRFTTPTRTNDRRRASWASRVATPDNFSVNGSSDTINLISPSSQKFTPISVVQQNNRPVTHIVNNPNARISPTSQTARNSPLPFSSSPIRKSSNSTSKPPMSPLRKLTPVPSAPPNVGLLAAQKNAQSIEILFEDEGEDGTEV